ncbi:MAG: sarcosine oxidase subunit gamma [Paracoccaceae bacterium]
MHDPATALNNAHFEGFVTLQEMPLRGMIALRTDIGAHKAARLIKKLTGCAIPAPNEACFGADHSVLWMSPDELLILCDYHAAHGLAVALREGLAGLHALVTVVSDARSSFQIIGPAWRDVLAKLTPADVSPKAFPAGMLRRSRIAQTAAAFWSEDGQSCELICFRSVAEYTFELLKTSAQPGSELGVF